MYTIRPEAVKKADTFAHEKYGIAPLTLMKNAAKSAYNKLCHVLSHNSKIVILCGKGNNGGDGYEIANILKREWYDVTAVNVFNTAPSTEEARKVYSDCEKSGIRMVCECDAEEYIKSADVILDAVFGVGFYGKIERESNVGRILQLCNDTTAFKIAIDVPSGINSLDGRVEAVAFEADLTVTMAYVKTGMLSYPAREYCGEIVIADVGYPKALCREMPVDALVADDEYIKDVIPQRKPNTHKGTYGRLLMYVGSQNMTGAAILSARAALKSGVGLLNIANDKETIKILQNHLIEPVFSPLEDEKACEQLSQLCEKSKAVLFGCGIGVSQKNTELLHMLIENANCNLIIDADGINCLCLNTMKLREAKKTPIVTPHPLEFARLVGKSVDEVQSDRINNALSFAKNNGCVIVLKGANTVIASPDGRFAINTSGNAGLSKGGSGDVLAGLIASLCTQGIPPFEAAVSGVYLHGKAGDKLRDSISEYGYLPSDLCCEIAKMLP